MWNGSKVNHVCPLGTEPSPFDEMRDSSVHMCAGVAVDFSLPNKEVTAPVNVFRVSRVSSCQFAPLQFLDLERTKSHHSLVTTCILCGKRRNRGEEGHLHLGWRACATLLLK